MALTFTPESELGTKCPDFSLNAVDGKVYGLGDFADRKALVVMFICNHCPYVKAIEDRLLKLGRELANKSVALVAVCSNDPSEYEEDSFENLKRRWKEKQYPFPYLHDQTQSMAKAFGAVCTPDFFVFDQTRSLTYRGRLDDNWKEPAKVTRQDLRSAIERILSDESPLERQHPAMGCSIKWL